MRTSTPIRGVLAAAAVTAGTLTAGACLPAAADAPPASCTVEPVSGVAGECGRAAVPPARAAHQGVRKSTGNLLVALRQVTHPSGARSTTAMAGLYDLPAVMRSTGMPRLPRGGLRETRAYPGDTSGISWSKARYGDRPATDATTPIEVPPVSVLGAPGAVLDPATVTGPLPVVDVDPASVLDLTPELPGGLPVEPVTVPADAYTGSPAPAYLPPAGTPAPRSGETLVPVDVTPAVTTAAVTVDGARAGRRDGSVSLRVGGTALGRGREHVLRVDLDRLPSVRVR
ncbi:hypothetical protein [Sphaerisporangium sp. TRM90804]|uniref:hypothetical protein n=1 Tax=Sphaerisporangium sp. TRM90804 TaxID=3031113 RepID=UPI002448ADF9|nr:hypothetical protein [Sphaerisporangium sp. TRM90804]MDH2426761.1 hypothetical protein [Sphaerisporangium sp. TRM90804]